VDATGQDAFLARRDRTTVRVDDFGRAAVFTHYASLGDESLEALGPDGNIRVLMHDDGWSWVIPLPSRRLSVGTVTRRRKANEDALEAVVAASPMLGRLTRGARPIGTTVTRNFSYRNAQAAGSRFACVGDAAYFIDPVFSSGVALALLGAEHLVDHLATALEGGTEDDPTLTLSLQAHMSHAYTCLGALVHGFYHTRMVKNLFFARRPDPAMRSGLITMLTGDLWRDDNPFQNALLASRRRMTAVE
jgi:2-polyprenyl-6-methoxyphenol hydroxylase-like FAD-dependent oxidoreductase